MLILRGYPLSEKNRINKKERPYQRVRILAE